MPPEQLAGRVPNASYSFAIQGSLKGVAKDSSGIIGAEDFEASGKQQKRLVDNYVYGQSFIQFLNRDAEAITASKQSRPSEQQF